MDEYGYNPYQHQMYQMPTQQKGKMAGSDDALNTIQGALSLAGMLPGVGSIADLTNAGINASRGRWGDAAMDVFFALPGIGDIGGALKGIGGFAQKALKFGR